MSVLKLLVLIVLLLPIALYIYIAHNVGKAGVNAVLKLLIKGCFKFKGFTRNPLALHKVGVGAAALDVFTAERVSLKQLSLWNVEVDVVRPRLNFLADSEGLLHVVALLQDVGYLEEAKAAPEVAAVEDERPTPAHDMARASSNASTLGRSSRSHSNASTLARSGNSNVSTWASDQVHTATFSGKAHAWIGHISMLDGLVDMPYDVGQIMGRSLEVQAALGAANVGALQREEEEAKVGEEWWQRTSSVASCSYASVNYPIMLLMKSENIKTSIRGWRTNTGFLLHRPIESFLHFSQDIAQFTLSKLHPLLGYAASLEGTDHIKTTLTPLGMHLPSEMMSLRLEPLKVKLKTKAIVKGLISFLNTVGRMEWSEPHTLEAWTSGIEADVFRSGLIVSKRMDILLGHNPTNGKGLHICMWGTVDVAAANSVDMVCGLPAHTLRRMGARDVADDFVYQMPVLGTAQSPEINFLKAGKDISEMILKSKLQQGLPFLKKVMRNPSEKRRLRQSSSEVPAPSLPFPWDAFPESRSDGEDDNKFDVA